jgi:TRAP-type C4-dicarboxylate transport system permease small subunit
MDKQSKKSFLKRLQTIINLVEDSILVGLLLLMIFLAVLQIFLRNFFGGGIVWSEVLVRVLVLWVGLIGAMVASRQGNHINIDIMNRYLSGRVKFIVQFVVELFTALICIVVAYYSLEFVQIEFAYGSESFAKVPTWLCESIIPFAFMVISLRYFLLCFINLKKIIKFPS